MFVLACMLHRAQFSDISQAHISFWKRFHASLCGCITTRHLFFFFYSLSKPTDTPKQSRRSRLWYIKSERKWKIDFSQNGIVELLTLFGNILMFSTDLKRKKKNTHIGGRKICTYMTHAEGNNVEWRELKNAGNEPKSHSLHAISFPTTDHKREKQTSNTFTHTM